MILTTEHLTKRFDKKIAVNELNLNIEQGSFTALLGPNGAGKSTTMQLLLGLTTPTTGKITYADQVKIGVVFQASVLDTELTVKENLQLRARQYRQVDLQKVTEVSQQLGLTTFMNQRYGTLSGGQRRRVDIARALLNDPDILFLDEPTTALDIQTRTAIWDLLRQLQREQGLTIVLTTHYLSEADAADNVYVIDHGHVIAQGTATAIKAQHAASVLQITTSNVAELCRQVTMEPLNITDDQVTFHVPTSQAALTILTAVKALMTSFEFRPGTMDDAFLALTGRELR
ncbi:ABC transporter ATP-binding protein [Lactiplantibacillus mudanjiangensis]|uniref:ABC transporter ATP-binding protein [Lactobacillus koreensis] n=1 Tax=Lactiplantibacillus mudanjiangensis TaxID=1296538 RepID=A0A660DZ71_9LACO|nr:ABC transporter ATP-binding protein [Lactiplantibacillus mudanjiangensis]VDG25436.1 ABC transporter ATP-binding protein [Lactobacillus koreensis] [Lactiplantibacillus mudanjiangensis]VDG28537.1 ABC transporter ATP-binding protein [Lactobacillus koreensis] [Lactiplantibacillus mudanjiangensis]